MPNLSSGIAAFGLLADSSARLLDLGIGVTPDAAAGHVLLRHSAVSGLASLIPARRSTKLAVLDAFQGHGATARRTDGWINAGFSRSEGSSPASS